MTVEAAPPDQQGWTPTDSTFGARLALIRQRMAWGNVKEAAEACGLPAENWRRWERDGIEPRRLTTIAMTIATRTGCDYLWLVHGPNRGSTVRTKTYVGTRVVGQIRGSLREPAATAAAPRRPAAHPVRQTQPIIGSFPRPATPMAV